ncbi:MAG: TetR/AcrR family transcriptional regulator [Xanthomonadales bacterium]|nr:TetR/AcrR family transcriptional regulator [Xanthomonadales bacterium]
MNKAVDTRTQIIDRASELMMQRGFNGFSYSDISTPLGVKNAAIHYHFPSKSDLIRALVEEHHETLRHKTSRFMAHGGPAREQLEGLFCFTLEQCRAGRPVCVVGALAADYDELPQDVHRANERFMEDTRKWMTRVLELGREQGEFSFAGDAQGKAFGILAAMQGGRQLYRIYGEAYLQRLFAQIRLELGIQA